MSKQLLITFGCSWTYGVGVGYQDGMAPRDFAKIAWNPDYCDQYSFRSILSKKFNMDNVNISKGGSSNQEQFRLAENFFSSTKFFNLQNKYNDIVVLWGITSILRNEIFFNNLQYSKSFFYTDKSLLSKVIITEHFNERHELLLLRDKIKFWNNYFDSIGITNHWFDTFNHHDYADCLPNTIKESYLSNRGNDWPSWEKFSNGDHSGVDLSILDEILDPTRWDFQPYFYAPAERLFYRNKQPRDLMSQLALRHGLDELESAYHTSDWKIDNNRVKFLTDLKLLNPYSHHPTMQGHKEIANILEELFL